LYDLNADTLFCAVVRPRPISQTYGTVRTRGRSSGGDWGDRPPPKTYESNFIHHDFVQFGKQHSQYKAILPSIVFSQQGCEVYSTSPAVVNP